MTAPKIAMARFGWMDEMCGCSCRGQGRGNLSGDMAGFPHAADDDAAFDGQNRLHRPGEVSVQLLSQSLDCGRGVFENAPRGRKIAGMSVGDLSHADDWTPK